MREDGGGGAGGEEMEWTETGQRPHKITPMIHVQIKTQPLSWCHCVNYTKCACMRFSVFASLRQKERIGLPWTAKKKKPSVISKPQVPSLLLPP